MYGSLSHELRLLDICYEFSISNKIYQNRKNTQLGRRKNTKKNQTENHF